MKTSTVLEKQRHGVIHEAAYELGMRESNAASTEQKLEQQVHRRFVELSCGTHDFEHSRGGQSTSQCRTTRSRRSSSSSSPSNETRSWKVEKLVCSPCVPDIHSFVHFPGQCSCTLFSAPLLMRAGTHCISPSRLRYKSTLYIGHICCVLLLIIVAEP